MGLSYFKVTKKLEQAESEIQRLRLRVEARPSPYYQVISAFFPDKKAVEPEHVCTCNICCLDMESIKKKAIEQNQEETKK